MAMDFWKAQRKQRFYTFLYVSLFLFLSLCAGIFAELSIRVLDPEDYSPLFPYVGLLFFVLTIGVSCVQYALLCSNGGKYVAESLNGRLVTGANASPEEMQLLNIVQEVAIASSLPVPPLYILPAKEINAFAAGTRPDNAVIAVTQGAMQKLNRDEIQGVIAHEFGHIANSDVKLSLRIAAMVAGFFFLMYMGARMLQFSRLSSGDGKQNKNVVVLVAFILMLIGALMWFFGSLFKATISRSREYLADACSVQYTRNPNGIVGALTKIQKDQVKDMPATGMAYSHMYFEDRSFFSSLFATHPSIKKRIEAILGGIYSVENTK